MSEKELTADIAKSLPYIDLRTVNLKIGWYQFQLVASEDVSFRSFSGSAWRGLFGHALRKTVCVTGMPECSGCLLSESCAYPYLFETAPHNHADRMRRYSTIPHPFVIKNTPADETIKSEAKFNFEILLVGKANQYLPYLIQTFLHAGKIGIGSDKSKFNVSSVNYCANMNDQTWAPIWSTAQKSVGTAHLEPLVAPLLEAERSIRVTFKTPIRLLEKGKLVAPGKFRFSHLYKSLSRRISMLAYFHENNDFNIDYKTSLEMAEKVETKGKGLRLIKWKRYSTRQNKLIFVDGVIGEIEFSLKGHEELWPILWLGQFTHVGKSTSMGLGEYQVGFLESLSKNNNKSSCDSFNN